MLQNERFEPLFSDCFHHGWRKFWILMIWNALEWRIWSIHLRLFSPFMKEILDSEWRIWTIHLRLFSPWLKEILDFDGLKCPRMKDLNHLSQTIFTMVEENCGFWWSETPPEWRIWTTHLDYFHNDWRKFRILMIWNAPEWKIWSTHLRLFQHGWRKFLILMIWNTLECDKLWPRKLIKNNYCHAIIWSNNLHYFHQKQVE